MTEYLNITKREVLNPFQIHGAIPAVITPLKEDGELDVEGIHRLSDFLINNGVSALFVLGTTGESDLIPTDIKLKTIKTYIEASHGRVPILSGISQPELEDTLILASRAIELGSDAVVVKPLYLRGDPVKNIREIFRLIQLSPIMLYNIPGSHGYEYKGKSMLPEVLTTALEFDNFAGIKDSSNDLPTTLKYIADSRSRALEGIGVWQGFPNLQLESYRAGAVGSVQSLTNIEPQLFVDLYRASQVGTDELAVIKQSEVDRLFSAIPFNPNHVPTIKSILVDRGLISSARMFLPVVK